MPFDGSDARPWCLPGSPAEARAIAAFVAAGLVRHLPARRAWDLPRTEVTAQPRLGRQSSFDGGVVEARFHARLFGQREREARAEARTLIARYAFNQATPMQRHAASFRLAGARNKDVARILNVSEATAHVAHERGLRRMRRSLQDHRTVIANTTKNWLPADMGRGTSLEAFLANSAPCVRTTENPMPNDLLTPVECAATARISMASLYRRWANDEGPRSFHLGRKRLVRRADLFSWIAGLPAAD